MLLIVSKSVGISRESLNTSESSQEAPSRLAVLETTTHTIMDSRDLTIPEMCLTMPGLSMVSMIIQAFTRLLRE